MIASHPQHFDYLRAAREAGVTDAQLSQIERIWEADYPNDPHMRELHLLRTFMAIRDGQCTVEEALLPE